MQNLKYQNWQKPVTNCCHIVAIVVSVFLCTGCTDYYGQASPTLYWGAEPDQKRLEMLKEKGVKTLVNFRTNPRPDLADKAREMGFKYIHIRTGVFRSPSKEAINQFLTLVNDPNNQPTYIFCKGGRDRTAFYTGLYRMTTQGWSADMASDEVLSKVRLWWPTFRHYNDALHRYSDSAGLSTTFAATSSPMAISGTTQPNH